MQLTLLLNSSFRKEHPNTVYAILETVSSYNAEYKISLNMYTGWPTTAACGKKCVYVYKPVKVWEQ